MVHSLVCSQFMRPATTDSSSPFDLGGVRSKCSYANWPCRNSDNCSLLGDSKDSLKSRAGLNSQVVSPNSKPISLPGHHRDIPSRSAQNFEYSGFCDSSSKTTSTLFPTALLADTTLRSATTTRHNEEKSRILDTRDNQAAVSAYSCTLIWDSAVHFDHRFGRLTTSTPQRRRGQLQLTS